MLLFRRSFLPFSNFRASRLKKHATYVLHSVVLFLILCPSFLHLYLFSFHNVAPLLRRVRRLNIRVPFASVFNNRHVSLLAPCDFQIGWNPEISWKILSLFRWNPFIDCLANIVSQMRNFKWCNEHAKNIFSVLSYFIQIFLGFWKYFYPIFVTWKAAVWFYW